MDNPDYLRYARTHEWVSVESSDEMIVGITDHAQDLLGDLVFVSLPEVGASFEAEEVCMFVESVKSASDIHMPLSGTITAVNADLLETPERVNEDAFGEGWLFKFAPATDADVDVLLDSDAYEASLDE